MSIIERDTGYIIGQNRILLRLITDKIKLKNSFDNSNRKHIQED